jgi:hypothetical protein
MGWDVTESPPDGLQDAGKALWTEILDEVGEGWTLDARELHLLQRACRCADELADLEQAVDADGGSRGQPAVHPALAESRQLRLVQLRLLGNIELPGDGRAAKSSQPACRTSCEKPLGPSPAANSARGHQAWRVDIDRTTKNRFYRSRIRIGVTSG